MSFDTKTRFNTKNAQMHQMEINTARDTLNGPIESLS